jgi:metal-dependent HD superfamily phosphatase/phosphodiesterase
MLSILHTAGMQTSDIHKYSANAIEKVKIGRGNERPLKIEIHMRAEVGFFQVE